MAQVDTPRRQAAHFPEDCARRFRPERPLGEGGYGIVWLARQVGLNRLVAVKLLKTDVQVEPEDVARFNDEARITARLSHASIVTVLDHGCEMGVPWIAYEYLPGRSLRAMMLDGDCDFQQACAAVIQTAQALEAAHAQGIIHRDVKPDNVLEVERGRYKITDFGLGKWAAARAFKTRTGIVMGTPAYMAPEMIQGAPASERSDQYALGVTLFELTTGRLPFDGPSPPIVMQRHVQSPIPKATSIRPELPSRLDAIVARAMAKRPEDRYATLQAMRMDIETLARGSGDLPITPRAAIPLTVPHATGEKGGDIKTIILQKSSTERRPADSTTPPITLAHGFTGALAMSAGVAALVAFALWWSPAPRPGQATASPIATSSPARSGSPSAQDSERASVARDSEILDDETAWLRNNTVRTDIESARMVVREDERVDRIIELLRRLERLIERGDAIGLDGRTWLHCLSAGIALVGLCEDLESHTSMIDTRLSALAQAVDRDSAQPHRRCLRIALKVILARPVAPTRKALLNEARQLRKATEELDVVGRARPWDAQEAYVQVILIARAIDDTRKARKSQNLMLLSGPDDGKETLPLLDDMLRHFLQVAGPMPEIAMSLDPGDRRRTSIAVVLVLQGWYLTGEQSMTAAERSKGIALARKAQGAIVEQQVPPADRTRLDLAEAAIAPTPAARDTRESRPSPK